MASQGLNKVQLIGNLGTDPELKYTNNGAAVLRMRIATTERWVKDGERQERTEWHTVIMFGNRGEALSKHLGKGQTVYVEGRLQTRQWEDKDGGKRSTTEIVANDLLFLGGGKGDGGQRQERTEQRRPPSGELPPDSGGGDFGDDDIPFAARDGRLP